MKKNIMLNKVRMSSMIIVLVFGIFAMIECSNNQPSGSNMSLEQFVGLTVADVTEAQVPDRLKAISNLLTNPTDFLHEQARQSDPLQLNLIQRYSEYLGDKSSKTLDVNRQQELIRGYGYACMFSSPFYVALYQRNAEAVRLFLRLGANITDFKGEQGFPNSDSLHLPPLHTAASRGSKEITQLLLAAHADVTAKDGKGNGILFHAKDQEIREMLLLAGAQDLSSNS